MLPIPLLLLLPSLLSAHQIPEIVTHPKRTESGLHLPIYRRQTPASSLARRAGTETSSIGLGDFNDMCVASLRSFFLLHPEVSPQNVQYSGIDGWHSSTPCPRYGLQRSLDC
jgi:hypothetical protein